MADQNVSYKLNLNRNKTKKWQTAKQVDYGGDDWGEDEYDEYEAHPPPPAPAPVPQSATAGSARQQAWGPTPINQSQRSFTNPSTTAQSNRLSYEQNDDRRQLNLATSAGHPPIPAQPATLFPQVSTQRQQPPLHLDTQPQHSANRNNRMSEYAPIPVIDPPDDRPAMPQPPVRSHSPVELPAGSHTGVHESDAANAPHRPRTSSLSHVAQTGSSQPASASSPVKALPFIRPADIYKRIEEEREKERRSQDSSRPSLDHVSHESKNTPQTTEARAKEGDNAAISRTTTFESVDEKSPIQPDTFQKADQQNTAGMVSRQASSVYSGRRDPVSATSDSSAQFTLLALAEVSTPRSSFPAGSREPAPDQAQIGDTRRGPLHATNAPSVPRADELSHQPSLGYTSVIHKAFDNEAHGVSSPSTTSETLPRSNSASTSEISPIMTKNSSTGFGGHDDDVETGRIQRQVIPEETFVSSNRPESTATIKAESSHPKRLSQEESIVPPGFRRDSATPSPGNSPARQPRSIVTPNVPSGKSVMISSLSQPTEEANASTVARTGVQPSDVEPTGSHLAPFNEPSDTGSVISRTASQDYQEWNEQRRSFHATHGTDVDSNVSQTSSNPVSRSETPNKHATLDEPADSSNQSGFPNYGFADTSRPAQQDRLHSFRPSIPGGWQSDATITTTRDTEEVQSQGRLAPFVTNEDRGISTESIPTAKPPKDPGFNSTSPVDKAFAAAAAAGTALAGSFSGSAFSKSKRNDPEDDSEDEPEHDTIDRSIATESTARDFASHSPPSLTTHDHGAYRAPQLQEDEVARGVDIDTTERSHDTPTEPTSSQQQTPVEFPAPLRMSKVNENSPMSPRPSAFSPTTIASDEDPDQLQHDIVQSLTPQPSNVDAKGPAEPQIQPHMQREDSYDSVLPQEYSSYWRNESSQSETVHDQVTQQEEPEHSATLSGPLVDEYPIHHDISEHEISPERPKLEQQFSWEQSSSTPPVPAELKPSAMEDTTRDVLTTEQPPTFQHHNDLDGAQAIAHIPVAGEEQSADLVANPTVSIVQDPDSAGRQAVPLPLGMAAAPTSYPAERVDFQSILGYNDPHKRIAAFDENRRLYSEQNGLLDHWLASLNIPEHADVFVTSRQQRPHQSTPQAIQTTPRRDNTIPSSTRQMQEDGKRILAAAGKYGGKAGIAAKGLFAKGKDKFRTASAGDKGSSTQTKPIGDDVSSPTSPESQRSAYPSNAPQLPTPTLSTPVEDISWSLISSTIDQIFVESSSPHPRMDADDGQQLSQLGIRGEVTRKNDDGVALQLGNGLQSKSAGTALQYPITNNPKQTVPLPGSPSTQPDARVSKALPSVPPTEEKADSLSKSSPQGVQKSQSDVSEISDMTRVQNPQGTAEPILQTGNPRVDDANMTRSNTRTQEVPIFLSQSISKEADSRQETPTTAASRHTSLPPYRSPALDKSNQRVPSGASIVPIAEFKGQKLVDRRGSGRPFSFAATDTMSSVPSYHPGGSPPPITPIDGHPRVTESDQKNIEPNIMEHPAYRQENESGEEHQNQSNPLPSSRRSPEELQQVRRQSKQPDPVPEQEGYRIPGPYVSEYRSPRPKGSFEQFSSPSTTRNTISPATRVPTAVPTEQPAQEVVQPPTQDTAQLPQTAVPSEQLPNQQSIQQQAQHPVRPQPPSEEHQLGFHAEQNYSGFLPSNQVNNYSQSSLNNGRWEPHTRVELNRPQDTERTRNRPFGNIFRNRAESRNRDERQEPVYSGENRYGDKKKRNPFFRVNNRSESPNRFLGDVPEQSNGQARPNQGGHRRMLSSDLLKNKAFGNKSAEGRRKRTSGLAGLFSRAAGKDKGRSSTSLSHRSDFEAPSQQRIWQPNEQYADQLGTPHQNIGNRSNHYLNPQGATPIGDDRYATPTSTTQIAPVHHSVTDNHLYNDRGDNFETRPDQLWVDTTNHNHQNMGQAFSSSTNTPFTANSAVPITSGSTIPTNFSAIPPVPVTRARRDISYGQDRPYIPPTSEHVKNLNKRSRSPRLGKPPSDEYLNAQYGIVPGAADAPDPAENLGTFYNKKASPVGIPRSNEEQEKPWTLTLPAGQEENAEQMAKRLESTAQPELRGRHRSAQGQPGVVGLTDSQNISDILNKSVELKMASNPAASSDVTAPSQEHSTNPPGLGESLQSPPKDRSSSVFARTPSPFLSGNDWSRHPKAQRSTERFIDQSGIPRSTTPATSPPVSFRNFLNTTNDAARAATPSPSTITGNTITTTTTTSRGSHGLVTNMNTIVTPGGAGENFTPIERPPSTAPLRFSQARSATPLQPVRSPTPRQVLASSAPLQEITQTKTDSVQKPQGHLDETKLQDNAAPTTTAENTAAPSKATRKSKDAIVPEVPPIDNKAIQAFNQSTKGARSSIQRRAVSPDAVPHKAKPLAGASEPHPSKMFAPVELPGSKPDGYESDDEPVMSATFMPGQEWMPTSFDRYED